MDRPLYLMAAMTGLRQGELLALRWIDLDLQAFKVRVRQAYVRGEFKSPKSRRGFRGVPLADRLIDELEQMATSSSFTGDEDLVFGHPVTNDPLDRSKVLKRFQASCRRAGVRVVRFHDLRHTFGTRIAASGEVSLRTLQEWMGHRDARTTLIYADDQRRDLALRCFASSEAPVAGRSRLVWDREQDAFARPGADAVVRSGRAVERERLVQWDAQCSVSRRPGALFRGLALAELVDRPTRVAWVVG